MTPAPHAAVPAETARGPGQPSAQESIAPLRRVIGGPSTASRGASALGWVTLWMLLTMVTHGALVRERILNPEGTSAAGFTALKMEATGVRFTNILSGDAQLTNAVAHNGSGVALGDVDGDGWVDIYLCGLQTPNRLFRNRGAWKFEEMNLGSAACSNQLSSGATFADVDGDGDLDLLVSGIGQGTRLFLNSGKGAFEESQNSGLSRTASPMSLALADIDGDGDLDLYCAHYLDFIALADPTIRVQTEVRNGRPGVQSVNGQPANLAPWKNRFVVLPDGQVKELPEVDGFYRNDGQGKFTAIQNEPGTFQDENGKPIAPYRDWGLGVMFRDINSDGAPDFCVANDSASPVRFWINNGNGTFREIASAALRHTSRSSMGLDFADLDRDGFEDFILLDMLAREHPRRMRQLAKNIVPLAEREEPNARPGFNRNTLFFGQPGVRFTEAALWAGIAATDWSWCPMFLDVDLDGYEDLLITNGFEQDILDQDAADSFRTRKWTPEEVRRYRGRYPTWHTTNAAFRNQGNGRFENQAAAWGFETLGKTVSNGMANADLDNDGDLDLVINNLNSPALLLRNNSTAARLAIRLIGGPGNTYGIGARLKLTGSTVVQSQEMICGGRYLSGDAALRVFAAQPVAGPLLQLEVLWRDGRQSTLTNLLPNRYYEIDATSARPAPSSKPRSWVPPFFTDSSSLVPYSYRGSSFDDWALQPLVPRRLSRLGPGLSWFDLNGDGWDDLFVPAARNGQLAVFINDNGTNFTYMKTEKPSIGDQGSIVGWSDGLGHRHILFATSNYEMAVGALSRIQSLSDTEAPQDWPAGTASTGPLVVADFDNDLDLDVFLGAGSRAGRYPDSGASTLWINNQGTLTPPNPEGASILNAGIVNGAISADLDHDGRPELILATEGGPVQIWNLRDGRWQDLTKKWGLSARTGFWTGVCAGDFDGNGLLDLAVGNRGRNTPAELYSPGPWRLYYGNWLGDDQIQLLEAAQHQGRWRVTANRNWLGLGWPELNTRFATHAAFGSAAVEDVLGNQMAKSKFLEVSELESGVLLNRGDRFEWRPLPREAQWSEIFSLQVGDLDGDGREDLFATQNFFGTADDLTRQDGGAGLWLLGLGDGNFKAQSTEQTGFHLLGEQRGAALADFDHDGRVDLAVAQTEGPIRLYRNRGGKPGWRIVLDGPPENPAMIGTQMRWIYKSGQRGPVRTVLAGSGFWSQNSATQILGIQGVENPIALGLRWPTGREQTLPVNLTSHLTNREVVVEYKK